MLAELIGLRLESIRLSKMSWVLEFEGVGARPARYTLSSSAAVKCAGSRQDQTAVFSAIQEILEDHLMDARHYESERVVTLTFRTGTWLEFSNRNHEGGDNSAIVSNLSTGEWEILS